MRKTLLTILLLPLMVFPRFWGPSGGAGPASDALLLETGDYVLQETDDFILLE